jgi:hypothetical protein
MTGTTVVAEVAGHMVRVRRLGKLSLMTLVAVVEHELIVSVRVARLALRCNVCACQREVRIVMIE